ELASQGAALVATAPALDTSARIYEFPPHGTESFEAIALWGQRGRAFEFRTTVPDVAGFERRLAALRSVDRDAWIAALHRSNKSSSWLRARMVTQENSMKWSLVPPSPALRKQEEK